MSHEIVVKHLSDAEIQELQINSWPIWEKEVSSFPWSYAATESCLIIEGEVTVTPEFGQPVEIKAGDFAVFPKGMNCHWNITKDIRKHYSFS